MARSYPTGVGIYLRALKPMSETPKRAAQIAKDSGVSFVAIYVVQQDISNGKPRTLTINQPADVQRYTEAFATAGVTPWIWGYPWAGREDEFVAKMHAATSGNIVGWILDPELGYKWKGSGTKAGQKEADPNAPAPTGSQAGQRAAAKKLVVGCLDAMTEKHNIGVTSYGCLAYHKNYPAAEFCVGWGSPQLYDVSPAEITRGLADWRKLGFGHIIPSVPAFGAKSGAALHDFLSCFVDGTENIDGFLVWSWPQLATDEWRVLARWADWFKRYPQIVK